MRLQPFLFELATFEQKGCNLKRGKHVRNEDYYDENTARYIADGIESGKIKVKTYKDD